MKDKLRWIIPLSVCVILIGLLVGIYFLKPRLKYVYDSKTDTYLVDKAYGFSKEYTIPEEYKGKVVSGINVRAFYKHGSLEKITFAKKENIKEIKRLAFSECKNLKEIDLSSVELIERNAFSYDEKLNNLVIGAKNVGSSAFYKCTALENVTLLEGVETIGAFSFSYTVFKTLKLPKTMKNVYDNAFKYQETYTEIFGYYTLSNTYLKTLKGYKTYND